MDYNQYWEQIFHHNNELRSLFSSYWQQYSDMTNWQFWLVLTLLVSPLILLYFTVDRKRIFEVFFFGYTVHILWTYADMILARNNLFIHPYFLVPILPYASNMTASVLPVGFLLLYQYCTNHNKNFYLYTILLSALFAFGFATIEEYSGLVFFRKGMHQVYLFILDLVIAYITYWITRLLIRFKKAAL
ncbi:hypothetical protein [Sutcliffiella halmapala]|uniref:hypothetical protein n=1 Tax=Sutcliffiella halmapala TaxID=79882 RepID=UPI0009955B07|nr:hypothetical protein [Sutcliffiella halmapala]